MTSDGSEHTGHRPLLHKDIHSESRYSSYFGGIIQFVLFFEFFSLCALVKISKINAFVSSAVNSPSIPAAINPLKCGPWEDVQRSGEGPKRRSQLRKIKYHGYPSQTSRFRSAYSSEETSTGKATGMSHSVHQNILFIIVCFHCLHSGRYASGSFVAVANHL